MATMNSWGSSLPAEVEKGGTGQSTLLIHGLLAGNATSGITSLAVMTDGQLLVGSSAADPAPHTITSSDSTIAFTTGGGTLSFQARAGTEDVTGVVEFATGAETTTGTSTALAVHPDGLDVRLGTQTDHGVMLGGGGAGFNLGVTAVGTDGQVLVGSSAADPAWETLTSSDSTIAFTTGGGTLSIQARAGTEDVTGVVEFATGAETTTGTSTALAVHPDGLDVRLGTQTDHGVMLGGGGAGFNLGVTAAMTDGQLLIGSTGIDPVPSTLTAGSGIQITNAAGAITVTSTASGLGYTEVTGTSQQAAVDQVYTCNNAALVTVTLPDTAAAGSVITIIGKGEGKWLLAQNAGESIKFGTATTTEGAGGSLAATDANDVISITCITADTLWAVTSSIGNITVV